MRTYQYGLPIFGNSTSFNQVYGQASLVKSMPRLDALGDGPVAATGCGRTRWAFRLGGAAALPLNGEFFSLGGGDQFRGYDLSQRQGSITWVGSVEWRVPVFTDVSWDLCDHVAGIRNVYLAPFYDVGDAYVSGHSLGPTAHAVGAGLRSMSPGWASSNAPSFAWTSPKPSAATRRCNFGLGCSIRFSHAAG